MSDFPASPDRPAPWAVVLLYISALGALVAAALLGADILF